jgi:HSP20 family protein
MALIPKDPLAWLNLFRQQMTTIYRHLTQLEQQNQGGTPEFSPSVDISETADRFVVELDLPGVGAEDLSVTVCCSLLVIEGEKRPEPPPRTSNLFCLERRYGRFSHTVEIPPGFALDQEQARLNRGVLTVSFPRLPATIPVVRKIAIAQGDFDGRAN